MTIKYCLESPTLQSDSDDDSESEEALIERLFGAKQNNDASKDKIELDDGTPTEVETV